MVLAGGGSSGDYRAALQTWEYAPGSALRSWAYLAPYAAFARLVDFARGGSFEGDARTFAVASGCAIWRLCAEFEG